ncbi:NAD(P)/FAD-dependent oxidoreductase [Thermotalea metallivorans]|uniref:NADH:ubiquinone reductase (non-electrogenic) n=1 Tax=Thermotalea metallivorans TaxID=520762 RepID=A0A140L931_9FIRM|nr:NAD(P)/FAD-dependent oxidoreductase [Thermotalea metallivorans]KXG77056.1 NADH dehydrogenase-like protein YjlD [Thermotalea metallivorans]
MKRVIVLGAGYAGIDAALTLHKKLKKEDVSIAIIDKNDRHTLLTELHEVAGNRVDEESVKIYLKDIFQYTKVHVIQDEIQSIDFESQTLISDNNAYPYDYLIIGCGSEPAYFGIEGMEENAFTLWSLEDAKKINRHIRTMFQLASQEKNFEKRKEYLTFVVGGGGFTGIEMVGELIQWRDVLCKEYNISRNEVRLIVVEAMDKILAVYHQSLIDKAMKYLAKNKVEVFTNSPITKVAPDHLELKDGALIKTHTVIWTGGIKVNSFVEKLGLPAAQRGRGRVEVNEYAQSTKYPNVFLVGDNSYFVEEDGKPLPLLVESAIQTGRAAAKNVVNLIRNKPLEKCKPKLHGTMVSIGRKYAVADTMGIRTSGWMALLLKHMVNIHYQFEVAGFEQVIRYLKHQFVHRRKDDSIIKKHLTTENFTFWMVIMRVYLGYMWLMQGIHKYNDGWLSKVSIYAERITGAAANATASASQAADATASASQAVEGAAEVIAKGMNLIGQHTPDWYAWICENIIVPNAMFFQTLIVLTELGLGIAFITGTFTFIAAIISIGMNINFLLSTGLYDYWYLVTSIACLGGAGRAFGVDHYLIPWLMRQWRYFSRNKSMKINV